MPIGSKILPVIVGEAPLQQNIMTDFIVVDTPSAYNAILGRPFLSGIRGVLSIHHNVLKFPVGARVGEVRGDQQAARHCHAVSTDLATLAERSAQVAAESSQGDAEQDHYIQDDGEVPDIVVEDSEEEEQGWASGHPPDQLENISIKEGDLTKVVKIGGELDDGVKEDLIKLLREYSDIFAWSHEEMPGIPLSLATHRLAIDATFKPVKQKR